MSLKSDEFEDSVLGTGLYSKAHLRVVVIVVTLRQLTRAQLFLHHQMAATSVGHVAIAAISTGVFRFLEVPDCTSTK